MWILYFQNSSSLIRRFIRTVYKRELFFFFLRRLFYFLCFVLFYLTLIGFLNAEILLTRVELYILIALSVLAIPFFLFAVPSRDKIIKRIEDKVPELQARLFLFFNPFVTDNDSRIMYEKSEKECAEILKHKNPKEFSYKGIYGLSLIFFFSSLLIFLFAPFSLKIKNPQIHILFRKSAVEMGKDTFILVRANLPRIYIRYGHNKQQMRRIGKDRFGIIFKPDSSRRYFVGFRKWYIPIYIAVKEPLQIERILVRIHFPVYLNIPDIVDSTGKRSIRVISGAFVNVSGIASRKLTKSVGNVKVKISDNRFNLLFPVKKDTVVKFRLYDESGISSNEISFYIDAIPDNPPKIRFLYPIGVYKLKKLQVVPITIKAEDDYGLKRVWLKIGNKRIGERDLEGEETYMDSFPLVVKNLLPGETLKVYAACMDIAKQVTFSTPIEIFMPSMEEIFSGLEEATDTLHRNTGEIIEKEEQLKEQIENFLQKEKFSEEDYLEIRKTLEAQNSLIKKIEKMKKIAEVLQSPEVAKEMKRIKELLNSIDVEELKKNISQSSHSRSDLDMLRIDQSKLISMLKMGRELLEKVRDIMELNKYIKKSEEILHKQMGISERKPSDSLSTEEKQLSDSLRKTMDGMKESEIKEIRAAVSTISDIPDEMSKLGTFYKQGRNPENQEISIEQKLSDFLDQLRMIKNKMTGGKIAKKKILSLALGIRFTALEMNRFINTFGGDTVRLGRNETLMDHIEHKEKITVRKIKDKDLVFIEGIKEANKRNLEESKKLFIETMAFSPAVFILLQEAEDAIQSGMGQMEHSIFPQVTFKKSIQKMLNSLIALFETNPAGASSMLSALQKIMNQQVSIGKQLQSLIPLPSEQRGKGLQKLAGEERKLAKETGKLGDAFRPLAEEMRRLAEEFEKGYINQSVLKKQERVIRQFLEAERSIRRREISKKRKSEPGKYYPPVEVKVPQNLGEKNIYLRELLNKRIKTERYPEEFKREIEEYFRKLVE